MKLNIYVAITLQVNFQLHKGKLHQIKICQNSFWEKVEQPEYLLTESSINIPFNLTRNWKITE